MRTPREPEGIRLGIARGISYGLFGAPEQIVEPMRELGAGLVRVYVYWNQVQPRPDSFDWTTVDALLSQLSGSEEVWVTVCSSSQWATREATDFLPPSPATDDDAYHRFVGELVSHCGEEVSYWQCENEPSNVGLLWAGSADEYVGHLRIFSRAVRGADPGAAVVLGGCGYDVLSSQPGGPARAFFDRVLGSSGDCFDLFDVHLYDDPRSIPAHLATVRSMMRAHGYERPVVVGEYNGPTLFELPELDEVIQRTMAAAFAGEDAGALSTGELAANAELATPERRALTALYDAMPELPEELQMFMAGCAPELDERRDRINCREIVSRNLFALSEGVSRTVCWQLAPEIAGYEDPFTMMELMHGKLPLLAYDDGELGRRRPAAVTFALLAMQLEAAGSVRRIGHPELFAFGVERGDRGPLIVAWKDGDLVSRERDAPVSLEWPWRCETVVATDAFGAVRPAEVNDGLVRVALSITPTFLEPGPTAAN